MTQNLTITLDCPANCTLKFDESTMKVYFEKDDTIFKQLLTEAFDALPRCIESMPIWFGQHTHDGNAYSQFILDECNSGEKILNMLDEKWGEEKTNTWLGQLEESVPNWAMWTKDEIYRGWDATYYGTYLYVTRDFKTFEDED